VVLVRATAAWSDDDWAPRSAATSGAPSSGATPGMGRVRLLLARGAARTRDDLPGSALLVGALAMCVVLVWMLTPLVLVTGGLLSLAAVAVETRRLDRL
jgi:hypothetical protein